MILLARYGRDKCHVCGNWATGINEYDTGGCWHGNQSETLTKVPVCCVHAFGCGKVPGLKRVSLCGGSGGPGNPEQRAVGIKATLDELFPAQQQQLVLF